MLVYMFKYFCVSVNTWDLFCISEQLAHKIGMDLNSKQDTAILRTVVYLILEYEK